MTRRLTAVAIVAAIIIGLGIYRVFHLSPDGIYHDYQVGAVELVYWDFHDGKVAIVELNSRSFKDGIYSSNFHGTYRFESGKWLLLNTNGLPFEGNDTGILKPTPWSIQILSTNGDTPYTLPRIFLRR